MPIRSKIYAYTVIAAGAATMVLAVSQWPGAPTGAYWLYLVLALAASLVKLRLPGVEGTYSLGFFFTLFGLGHFSLPETLAAVCGAALAQSLLNTRKRPTFLQLAFNTANLSLSTGICFWLQSLLADSGLVPYGPARLVLITACYFAVNTGLVSGILSLLQKKRLAEVSEEWYVWSFPYYLVGAALLGFVPVPGGSVQPEGAFILLPLLYLVHFYYGLSRIKPQADEPETSSTPDLPQGAKLYIDCVIGSGVALLAYALLHSNVTDSRRFLAYLALTGAASLCKVRLPRMDSTISLNFVLLLAAAASLSFSEVAAVGMLAGVAQSVWKMKRRPQLIQVLFNSAALALSTALAYAACQSFTPVVSSPALLLPLATVVLFGANTLLMATVMCLVERRPLSSIWQSCCFWSLPYYLVGSAVAALMVATQRAAGWGPALAVLPVLMLVYVSYRAQVHRSQQSVPLVAKAAA